MLACVSTPASIDSIFGNALDICESRNNLTTDDEGLNASPRNGNDSTA